MGFQEFSMNIRR